MRSRLVWVMPLGLGAVLLCSCASSPSMETPAPAATPTATPSSPRNPAGYVPRANELRENLAQYEARVRGIQQDILDLEKIQNEWRKVAAEYRRQYPEAPSPAEEDVMALQETLQPVFSFFKGNLRPDPAACGRLVRALLTRAATEDSNTAIRLTEKLCRLPASQIN